MSFNSAGSQQLTTTASQLSITNAGVASLYLRRASAVPYYIGGSGVTPSTGFKINEDWYGPLRINSAEPLYAVVASGTLDVTPELQY